MKELLFLLFLFIAINADATHWLSYYVYSETQYMQGPWSRTEILNQSNYRYLAPHYYKDLFGTVDEDLINKMISRLKDLKPEVYSWDYHLSTQEDTVKLYISEQPEHFETIQNEITATLVLNDFEAVTFDINDRQETLTIDDLTLPYFDLVSANKKQMQKNDISPADQGDEKNGRGEVKFFIDTMETQKAESECIALNNKKSLLPWLILSVIANIILIVFLVIRRK